MEKTIEEIREIVLAECKELCPRQGQQHPLYAGAFLRNDRTEFGIYHYWGGNSRGNATCICSISTRSEVNQDGTFFAFYALLGLETRELETRISTANYLIDQLRAKIADQYFELQAERAKTAKLVEVLEFSRSELSEMEEKTEVGNGGQFRIQRVCDKITETLEAHRKGGKSND